MINKIVRRAWVTKWIATVVWRSICGRWFIFRDAPDVIVRMIRMASTVAVGCDSYVSKVISEADREWSVRMMVRKKTKGK